MTNRVETSVMRSIIESYFRRVDAGTSDLVDLFVDDVEIYYPKFGFARGKDALAELGAGISGLIASMQHPIELMTFHASGNAMIVEGITSGVDCKGRSWSGGKTPGGRFCNVFTFRGGLIERLFIYLDPDRLDDDNARFLWGTVGRSW